MKAEKIKIVVKENAEITVKNAGGQFAVVCIGPGWVEVQLKRKPRKRSEPHRRKHETKTETRRYSSRRRRARYGENPFNSD
jgi:hypothetical protein